MADSPLLPVSVLNQLLPYLPTYTHLLIAALLPIYTGSHASIRRPTNTLTPTEARALRPSDLDSEDEEADDEEDEEPNTVETLSNTDALLFPVTAGLLLGGLYLLITYLDDPTLLSRLMTYYFSFIGTFSVSKTLLDVLNLLLPLAPTSLHQHLSQKYTLTLTTPLLATKKRLTLLTLLSPLLGVSVITLYTLLSKPWPLSNLLGISFSYQALQLLSPTSFPTSSLQIGRAHV